MQATERSSSVDLSSVPGSDSETPFGLQSSTLSSQHHAGNPYRSTGLASAPATAATNGQEPIPVKKTRKPRTTKPKPDPDAPKPARKPRAANGTGNARKKQKVEDAGNQSMIQSVPLSTNLQSSRLVEPYPFPQSHHTSAPRADAPEAAKPPQNSFSNPPPSMHSLHTPQPPQPQPAPPRVTSMYDPIRGSITVQEAPAPAYPSHVTHTPPRPVSRSGASPISSLIDPPVPSMATAPSPLRTFETPAESQPPPVRPVGRLSPPRQSNAMDMDGSDHPKSRNPSVSKKSNSEAPTRQGSPKPRAKEQAPPKPAGSGLLSASLFGGELSLAEKSDATATGPNIVLHIDLKDPKNQVVNFTRMAEEKYGFAALYPRQAAQRERLARVAAAGAALERSGSGSKVNSAGESGDDDGSVDIDRDSENDGDVAMGGINGTGEGNSGTEGEPKKKTKRRRKVEDYDLDDDFVDDSEQVWEAQAATSKEGFFVYCGPLVAEGEKPQVERYVIDPWHAMFLLTTLSGPMAQSGNLVEVVAVVVAAPGHVADEDLALQRRQRATLQHRSRSKSVRRQAPAREVARSPGGLEQKWLLRRTVNKRRSRKLLGRRTWPLLRRNLCYSMPELTHRV